VVLSEALSWPTPHPGSEPDEAAILADCDTLVAIGLAAWTEPGRAEPSPRPDEPDEPERGEP
jgi:hypothetical protein